MPKTAERKVIITTDHIETVVQVIGNHDVIVFQNAAGKEWGRLKINTSVAPRGEQILRQVIFYSSNSAVIVTNQTAESVWMSLSSND